MRYLRLSLLFLRVSLQNDAAYRLDFLLQIGSALLHVGSLLMTLWVFFHQTTDLNGWGPPHMLALFGVFRIMTGGIAMVIAPNMRQIMQDVRTGTLDFVLLKPINSQFIASMRRFVVWRLTDILLGVAMVAAGVTWLGLSLPIGAIAIFLVMLAAGSVIIYSFWLMLATTAFWLVKVANIEMVFWNVFEAARYPVSIYSPPVQWILKYAFPVAFVVTFPAQALCGVPDGAVPGSGIAGNAVPALSMLTVVAGVLLAPAMLAAATAFWRFGLKHYSGASA